MKPHRPPQKDPSCQAQDRSKARSERAGMPGKPQYSPQCIETMQQALLSEKWSQLVLHGDFIA